jgi:subtilisin family serine protease
VVLVVARGNDGHDGASYPACFKDDWILNIGAASHDRKFKTKNNLPDPNLLANFERIAWQSQYGKGVDLIAPGITANIYTTDLTGYTQSFGTSAATAHVSGSVALMLSLHNIQNTQQPYKNNLSPDDVEYLLQKNAMPVTGTGMIDDYDNNGNVIPNTLRTVTYNANAATNHSDIYNGWGFLDIGTTLSKIALPQYQILHPSDLNFIPNSTSNATRRKVSEQFNVTVELPYTIGSITGNQLYDADVYLAEEVYTHSFTRIIK